MPDEHVSTAEAYRGVKPAPVKESLYDLIKTPLANGEGILRMILRAISSAIIPLYVA
jgi:4-diphosphocytidyl-2-C-methyl-D-erythritol kinase